MTYLLKYKQNVPVTSDIFLKKNYIIKNEYLRVQSKEAMKDRTNFLSERRSSPIPREEEGSCRECRNNSTHMPKLKAKGKFIGEGATLYREWPPLRSRE